MFNKPLVSICIPNYNNHKFIAYAIDSALNQSYENIEIIVVDNNSTDKSWDTIKSYSKHPNINTYQNMSNVGMEKNFEIAFNHANGRYITFLCSDDILSIKSIQSSMNIFEQYDNLSFVFGNIEFINSTKKTTSYKFKTVLSDGEWTRYSLKSSSNFAFLSGTIFDTEFSKRIEDDLIKSLTFFDWYLWLRLGQFKVGFNSEVVGFHRYHSNNQTKIITPNLKKNYLHLLKVLELFKESYYEKNLVDKAIIFLKFRFSKLILENIGLTESFNFINEVFSKKSNKFFSYFKIFIIRIYSILLKKLKK